MIIKNKFWDIPSTPFNGLLQCVPRTHKSTVIMESNGVGDYFYDSYHRACRGRMTLTVILCLE
ncbi:MAG: hypothetical protein ACRCSD_09775 [Clostridium sp.]